MEFLPSFEAAQAADSIYILLAAKEKQLALGPDNLPFCEARPDSVEGVEVFLGLMDGKNLYALSAPSDSPLPAAWRWEGFIDSFRRMPLDMQGAVSRAKQLAEWRRTQRFCGSCGSENRISDEENVLVCPSCGELRYPVISPAVITMITRGDRILLAHNTRFPEGRYSHVAGFIEPGEAAEEAVRREILEEVGLEVENIRFFGSQPWPMPHSLMLGFTAECSQEKEPVPDGIEIDHAAWFTRDSMPDLPGSGSIAGRMLTEYLEGRIAPIAEAEIAGN